MPRLTEDDFERAECFDASTNRCPIAPARRFQNILYEAQRAFIGVLNGYTLASVMEAEDELGKLLLSSTPKRDEKHRSQH